MRRLQVLTAIEGHLGRIATALELAVAVPTAPAPPPGCLHPAERRTDLGGMGVDEEWVCGDCGYHQRPDELSRDLLDGGLT